MVHPYRIGRVLRQCAEPLDPEPARQTAPRPTARSKGIVRSSRTDPHPDGPSHPTVSVGRLALRFPVPKTAACDVSTLNLHLWRPMICKLTWVVCASPMPRTSVPPISLLWDLNTCSTRARTFERVLLPRFSHDRRCPPTPPTPCCRRSGARPKLGWHAPRYPLPDSAAPACAADPRSRGSCSRNDSCRASWSGARPCPFATVWPAPSLGRFPRLDPRVLLAPVALLGNRHDRRVDMIVCDHAGPPIVK